MYHWLDDALDKLRSYATAGIHRLSAYNTARGTRVLDALCERRVEMMQASVISQNQMTESDEKRDATVRDM